MVKENITPETSKPVETGSTKTEEQLLKERKSVIEKRLDELSDASYDETTVTGNEPIAKEERRLREELRIINTKLGLNEIKLG